MSETEYFQIGQIIVANQSSRYPRRLIKHLAGSLIHFPEDELKGLGAIWLLDEMTKDSAFGEIDIPRKSIHLRGMYYPKTNDDDSCIVLFIKAIYYSLDNFPFYEFTAVPSLCISKTLAHEIAHHLIATRGYALQSGENITDQESLADSYAQNHLEKLREQGNFRFAFWLLNQMAGMLHSVGVVNATKNKHAEAADYFYKAWLLNPELENVSEWYHLAKDKSKKETEASEHRKN